MSLPAQAADTQTSVYRYYDRDGLLLYVGITGRGTARNAEHNKTKDWWQFVVRQNVDHYRTREEAHTREVELIEDHTPPFNTQHNPAAAAMRAAYFQYRALPSAQRHVSPIAIEQALERKLPLHFARQRRERGQVEMATHIEHLPLARLIFHTPGISVFHADRRRSVGSFYGVASRGPFTAIQLHVRDPEIEIARGVAHVRRNHPKGTSYRIAQIWLES